MPKTTSGPPTPEQFLADFPPAIQTLAGQLRALICDSVPGAVEAVYPGWKLIGYRAPDGKATRYFAFVAPFPGHVSLGFEYGALMRDPAGLLGGDGKQVRTVIFRPGDALNAKALAELIREAAYVALARPRAGSGLS